MDENVLKETVGVENFTEATVKIDLLEEKISNELESEGYKFKFFKF